MNISIAEDVALEQAEYYYAQAERLMRSQAEWTYDDSEWFAYYMREGRYWAARYEFHRMHYLDHIDSVVESVYRPKINRWDGE